MKTHWVWLGLIVSIAGCGTSATSIDSTSADSRGLGEMTAREPVAGTAAEQLSPTVTAFIPDEFNPPVTAENPGFKLVPLGPDLVKIDYDAYMSSIEHLQRSFTRSASWPTVDISDQDAMQDMLNEQSRFQNRESFAYAVLTPDGTRERGCVYVQPSDRAGHDAVVKLWVTQAEYDAGFDDELYAWTVDWIKREWPFKNVAYPGRAIAWDTWDSMGD